MQIDLDGCIFFNLPECLPIENRRSKVIPSWAFLYIFSCSFSVAQIRPPQPWVST